MPDWKQCEGELVNGEFPLEQYLEGNATRPVFLTRFGPDRAVIRLESADEGQAGELVKRWNRAARLHHRNLAAIHAAGTCVLAGEPLAYLVTEYADENLAEVLKERPLTADEAREMLVPVADALAYLHGQGLVHGELQPSNILAVGDIVKISSEPVSAGDPAEDIRALGVMLGLVFTQPGSALTPSTRGCGGCGAAISFLGIGGALPAPGSETAMAGRQDCRLAALSGTAGSTPRGGSSSGSCGTGCTGREARGEGAEAAALCRSRRTGCCVAAAVVGVMVMNRTAGPVPSAGEPVRAGTRPGCATRRGCATSPGRAASSAADRAIGSRSAAAAAPQAGGTG